MDDVLQADTDIKAGLTTAEARRKLDQYGPNAIEEKPTRAFERLRRYFSAPIPWMIEAAAILSAILGDWADFSIIMAMLLVNAAVDYWQEGKAVDNAGRNQLRHIRRNERRLLRGGREEYPVAERRGVSEGR